MSVLSENFKQELLKNPNVESITNFQVHYTANFKIKAVEASLIGISPEKHFIENGIDPSWFISGYCASCLKRWKNKYQSEGRESLKVSLTGKNATGRPRYENIKELSYDELNFLVELQKEVIEDLKKQKALAKKKY